MNEKRECAEAVEVLYHFLDGELTTERRLLIQRHLDDCPPCLDAFDFEAELRLTIAQRCREHVPDELRVRVRRVIRELGPGDGPLTLPG